MNNSYKEQAQALSKKANLNTSLNESSNKSLVISNSYLGGIYNQPIHEHVPEQSCCYNENCSGYIRWMNSKQSELRHNQTEFFAIKPETKQCFEGTKPLSEIEKKEVESNISSNYVANYLQQMSINDKKEHYDIEFRQEMFNGTQQNNSGFSSINFSEEEKPKVIEPIIIENSQKMSIDDKKHVNIEFKREISNAEQFQNNSFSGSINFNEEKPKVREQTIKINIAARCCPNPGYGYGYLQISNGESFEYDHVEEMICRQHEIELKTLIKALEYSVKSINPVLIETDSLYLFETYKFFIDHWILNEYHNARDRKLMDGALMKQIKNLKKDHININLISVASNYIAHQICEDIVKEHELEDRIKYQQEQKEWINNIKISLIRQGFKKRHYHRSHRKQEIKNDMIDNLVAEQINMNPYRKRNLRLKLTQVFESYK